MKVVKLEDKQAIEKHFRENTDFHIYAIGDLDEFFFEFTDWFAIQSNKGTEEIAYLYSGFKPSTLTALPQKDPNKMSTLISEIKQDLPLKFYAHLDPGLIEAFGKINILKNFGTHYKMSLKNRKLLIEDTDEKIRRLDLNDIDIIIKIFAENFPENFFDKRMLKTGKYFGYFEKDELIGIAGIHTFSPEYKVAALGNIVTAELHRGKSICRKLTSALCIDLLQTVENIGLNVHAENISAINSYKRTGFEIIGEYEEFFLEMK